MLTVLVVDEEPLVLRSLARMFKGSPCSVLTADDSSHALSVLDERHVDVLITDYQMSGLTGVQLVQRAKQRRPNISTIVLTSAVAEAQAELHDNETVVLGKPWDRQKILELLFPPICEAA